MAFCAVPLQSRTIGMHPLYLGLPVALASGFSFLLPMSCVPNAFAYTRGYFTQIQMVLHCTVLELNH